VATWSAACNLSRQVYAIMSARSTWRIAAGERTPRRRVLIVDYLVGTMIYSARAGGAWLLLPAWR